MVPTTGRKTQEEDCGEVGTTVGERANREREGGPKATIAYLQELLQKQLGGNIDVLLPGNLKVPVSEPILSMPVPLLLGVPFVAFPAAGGASGSLSSSIVASESLFPQKM